MMALGPLAFAAPLALIGLLALPIIWRLLRAAPPSPRRVVFPPFALLAGLRSDEETQDRTPWWLAALRLAAAALVCFGLARPILNPGEPPAGSGPLVLAIDDGWSGAAVWDAQQRAGLQRIEAAGRDGRPVVLVFTAGASAAALRPVAAREARRTLQTHRPSPWAEDHADAAAALDAARAAGDVPRVGAPEWIASGYDHGDADALAAALSAFGEGRVHAPPPARVALALRPPETTGDGLAVEVARLAPGPERAGAVIALDAGGAAVARMAFRFDDAERTAAAQAVLPLPVRNRIALLRLETGASAGGAQVLDSSWRRPSVGLVAQSAARDRQPLLADLHYVERALAPQADIRRDTLAALLQDPPGVIVLTDAGRVVGEEAEALARYVADGGVLLRFAGPRLATRADALAPVVLRGGGRAFGGALAWDEPQGVAPFPDASPFAGLSPPDDAAVTRQVLAEPEPGLEAKTWARLNDGTPLVTADRRGRGLIILFHITASPDWSNLPFSGVFPEMLARAAAFADVAPAEQPVADGSWRLERALDATGRLVSAPSEPPLLDAPALSTTPPSLEAPPGVWRLGPLTAARNVIGADTAPAPLSAAALDGLTLETGARDAARPLGGWALGAAAALMTIDALAVLALSGALGFGWLTRRAAARAARGGVGAGGAAATLAATSATPAMAQTEDEAIEDEERAEPWILSALGELHLGYVVTGDPDIDAMSRAGLEGLSRQLWERTSIEPGDPVAVRLAQDPFEVLPLLYWPLTEDTPAPAPTVAARLDSYLKTGGVIVFDTRDAAEAALRGTAPHAGLRRIVDAVDAPPLAPVGDGHVMTKAFYLLSEWPGRWDRAQLWVEADTRGSARDGVSSVLVTSADWAAAWAIDEWGRPLTAPAPGGERQREMAYRSGVNLVMYVLTGNYKADQVHVPALLERLGQ